MGLSLIRCGFPALNHEIDEKVRIEWGKFSSLGKAFGAFENEA
jgi:hypothetical protein